MLLTGSESPRGLDSGCPQWQLASQGAGIPVLSLARDPPPQLSGITSGDLPALEFMSWVMRNPVTRECLRIQGRPGRYCSLGLNPVLCLGEMGLLVGGSLAGY